MAFDAFFLFQILGATVLALAATKVTRWLWLYVWLPYRFSGGRLAERYGPGSWALITGASDGLGKAFAQELARLGFNLILVSRTPSKLDRLKDELQALGVQVRTVAVDLSDTSPHTYEPMVTAVQELDLSVLINCVGTTVHRRYADVPAGAVRHLLAVNVSTTAIVTHTMLPFLLQHTASTGRLSALLNVGSIVGRFYWPGTQLYGACKSFIDHLSVPLAFEYQKCCRTNLRSCRLRWQPVPNQPPLPFHRSRLHRPRYLTWGTRSHLTVTGAMDCSLHSWLPCRPDCATRSSFRVR